MMSAESAVVDTAAALLDRQDSFRLVLRRRPEAHTASAAERGSEYDEFEATQQRRSCGGYVLSHCVSCLFGVLLVCLLLAGLTSVTQLGRGLQTLCGDVHSASDTALCLQSYWRTSQAVAAPPLRLRVNESLVEEEAIVQDALSVCLPCECPCDAGPYIYQRECPRYSEGIGSKMQSMKLSLTMAALTSFTFLASRDCLMESHTFSDLSDRLWLHRSAECDPCSLDRREVHLVDSARWHSKWWSEPMYHTSTCPAVTPDMAGQLLRGEKVEELGKVAVRDGLSEVYRVLNDTAVANHSRLVFAFPRQSRSLEFLNSCAAPVIRSRYDVAVSRQRRHELVDMRPELFHVVVHFRWGDVHGKGDTEHPDNRAAFPLSNYSSVVASIMSLPGLRNRAQVWFLSEGDVRDFDSFRPAPRSLVPGDGGVVLRLGENSTDARSNTLEDIDIMARADVLIGGESSFFALGSLLRRPEQRVLIGRIFDSNEKRNPKYADHGTGFYERMLNVQPFDLEQCRLQLEALPQYAAKLAMATGRGI